MSDSDAAAPVESWQVGLRIHLLGSFRAFAFGEELPPPKRVETLRVLVFLLLRKGEVLDRSKVAEALWPEEEASRGRFNLRHALHAIKKLLPTQPDGPAWLIASRSTVQWNPDAGVWLDVAELEAARQAAEADKPSPALEGSLATAMDAYVGPMLPSLDDDWIDQARERTAENLAIVMERLIGLHSDQGRADAAIEVGRRLVLHQPTREAAHRSLMRMHAARGDRAAALRQFDDCRTRLAEEIGVEPDAETLELAELIRSGRTLEPDGGSIQGVPDAPGLWAAPPKGSLPFVDNAGRRAEIVKRLQGARLLSLTGAAGVGKSRLAAEVAAEIAAEPNARVAWCDLGRVPQDGLLASVAKAVGLPPEIANPASATAVAIGQETGLIVFDNADALLDPLVPLLDRLRGECPALTLLITSREALRVTGEERWIVPPLSGAQPEAMGRISRGSYESEELLLAAVRSLTPSRAPTPAEQPLVARLVAKLDGLPLAIVLAAHWVSEDGIGAVMSTVESQGLAALIGRVWDAAPAGHTSITCALEEGWSRLSPAEQTLLRRLAIFPTSATLGDVEAVCADQDQADVPPIPRSARPDAGSDRVPPSDVLDLVARLAARSWLEVEAGRPFRYALLPTTRAWLLPRLEASGERAILRAGLESMAVRDAEGAGA